MSTQVIENKAINQFGIVRESGNARAITWRVVGMFVGDALAMPVHWYYDVLALQRDFGTVRDYQSPHDFHPSRSCRWPARVPLDVAARKAK